MSYVISLTIDHEKKQTSSNLHTLLSNVLVLEGKTDNKYWHTYIHDLFGGRSIVAAYTADVDLPKAILKLLQEIIYEKNIAN